MHRLESPCEINSIDYSNFLPMFTSGGRDCKIRLYDDITKSLISEFEQKHTNRIFCAKFSADDPSVLYSGGWDSTIQI